MKKVALMAVLIPLLEGFSQPSYHEFNKLEGLLLENLERRVVEEIAYADEVVEPIEYQYENFRQTYYSIEEGEVSIGSGYHYSDNEVKEINNVMHFNDTEYGWIPIYAININDVTSSGQNAKGIWNIYGSIIELTNGIETWIGLVGDACGQCSKDNKIDLWVYNNDYKFDIENVSWRYIRYGSEVKFNKKD